MKSTTTIALLAFFLLSGCSAHHMDNLVYRNDSGWGRDNLSFSFAEGDSRSIFAETEEERLLLLDLYWVKRRIAQ